MTRNRKGFGFMGFVALADTLFAVSAGLLLLNPIQFDSGGDAPAIAKPKPATPPPPIQVIFGEMQQVEERLDRLEASGPLLKSRAQEILSNE